MRDVIALVFDFDDTLLPDSTSLLLASRGVDPENFWKNEAKSLLDQGYDPTVAYLNLIVDKVGEGRELGKLTIADLRAFGSTLDDKFFPGVTTLRADLQALASEVDADIKVELYIVSGGLQDIIEGSEFVRTTFSAVYGCMFGVHGDGILKHIKRTITFTEKTRYLFEINKGIKPTDTASNQYLVNKFIAEDKRRVPFPHMIYVGDGLTDIPCFSLVSKSGGTAFGIFKPGSAASAKRALLEFLKTDRVASTHSPKFEAHEDLGALLRATVATIASKIKIDREQAIS